MVKAGFTHRTLKQLEKYLIRKTDFKLHGDSYDLILIVPSDKFDLDTKYSLIISAKIFDNKNDQPIIKELLGEFRNNFNIEDFNSLSRINILNSNAPLVKNINFMFKFRESVIEFNDYIIGGTKIEYGLLLLTCLDKLIGGNAVVLKLTTGDTIAAGIIRMDNNFDIIHYTGKGLRELYDPNITEEKKAEIKHLLEQSEEEKIENGYITKTSLDLIEKII
jgi:hypothetical protein